MNTREVITEVSSEDAPMHLDNSEASAWADGYNMCKNVADRYLSYSTVERVRYLENKITELTKELNEANRELLSKELNP